MPGRDRQPLVGRARRCRCGAGRRRSTLPPRSRMRVDLAHHVGAGEQRALRRVRVGAHDDEQVGALDVGHGDLPHAAVHEVRADVLRPLVDGAGRVDHRDARHPDEDPDVAAEAEVVGQRVADVRGDRLDAVLRDRPARAARSSGANASSQLDLAPGRRRRGPAAARSRSGSWCRWPSVVPFGQRWPLLHTSSRSARISSTWSSSTWISRPHIASHSGQVRRWIWRAGSVVVTRVLPVLMAIGSADRVRLLAGAPDGASGHVAGAEPDPTIPICDGNKGRARDHDRRVDAVLRTSPEGAAGRAERRGDRARRPRLRPARLLRLRHRHAGHRRARRRAGSATTASTSPSLCSPTRACLLTGRNHHARRHGVPHRHPDRLPRLQRAASRASAATLPRILRDNGYSTFAVGKWHLAPRWEQSASGPFDRWPLGLGFERYYGFLAGDTNQWTPELVRDNGFVEPPRHARGRLPPHRGPGRPGHPADPRPAAGHARTSRSSSTSPPARCTRRTTRRREWIDRYAGRVRRRVGGVARRAPSRARSSRASCPTGTDAARAAAVGAGLGRAARRRAAALRPDDGGVRRLPHPHRRADRPAARLPRARSARSTTRSCCSSPTTARAPRAARSARSTSTASPTTASTTSTTRSRASTTSAASAPTTTTRGAGRGPATRRSGCGSATRGSAACARR